MAAQERAKGVCPECGRVISGRAAGPEAGRAGRRWVALAPYNREQYARYPVTCLMRGVR